MNFNLKFSALVFLLLLGLTISAIDGFAQISEKSTKTSERKVIKTSIVRGATGAKLDEYLRRFEIYGFSGVLLVAKDDEILLAKGYGLADRARRRPATADTIFYIGSLTKQFTAAAVLKLEMQGKLRVTDTLDKFFKDLPADKKAITIHQLLTHSSGLGDSPDKYGSPVQKEAQLRRTMETKLNFEPGKKYLYSNAGYSLLGIIVENVSGQPYEEYLHENIFKPAGMFETGYSIPQWDKRRVARGYSDEKDKGSPLERPYWLKDGPSWALRGAGAMLSTLNDLYRWHLALENDEILSATVKRRILSPHVEMDEGIFYGYGWTISKTPRATTLVQHTGSDGIFLADFRRYTDENVVVIGFINNAYGLDLIQNKVPDIVFGNGDIKLPPTARAKQIAPAILQKYAGAYQLSSGAVINVAVKRDFLIFDPIGQEAVNLLMGVQSPQAETYKKLSEKIEGIFSGARKNDFTLLKANISEQRFDGYKDFLTKLLNSSKDSTPVEYQIIGTYPLWFAGEQPLATFVRAGNKNDAVLTFLTWQNDQIRGRASIGESDEVTLRVPFVARSLKSFAGFHIEAEKIINVNFKVNQRGEATALEFHNVKGIVTANRVSSF